MACLSVDAVFSAVVPLFLPEVGVVDLPKWQLAALAVLVAPALEELIFRAGLRSPIYLSLIGPPVAAAFAGEMRIALALAASGVVFGFVLRRALIPKGARMRYGRQFLLRYRAWFWLYTVAFGLMHCRNITGLTDSQMPWLLVLVIPQIVFGALAGYVRVRDGVTSAIALHTAANGLVLLLGA